MATPYENWHYTVSSDSLKQTWVTQDWIKQAGAGRRHALAARNELTELRAEVRAAIEAPKDSAPETPEGVLARLAALEGKVASLQARLQQVSDLLDGVDSTPEG
jgi:tRNA U34 5-carboxymethylaminomethyl modifying GTPase MnmE/TrmE